MRLLVFNLSILEAEASRSLGLWAAWSPQNSVLTELLSENMSLRMKEESGGKRGKEKRTFRTSESV